MNIFEIIRTRLELRAGLIKPQESKFKPSDLKKLEQTEWSSKFERLMRNRLLMGALRYGTLHEKRKKQKRWDLIGAIKSKVEMYEETGNTEYLVDMANYCLLAFELDDHPNKHFSALDNHHDHCKIIK